MNKNYIEIKAKDDFKLLKSLREYQEWTRVERMLGYCLVGVEIREIKKR